MRLLDYLKQIRIFRSIIYGIVGLFTYPGLALFNEMNIEGTEHLEDLPKQNVLFVSNHQTYFADVITFVHIFCAVKWKKFNRLGIPYYLLNPFTNVYFIAAEETMNDNWLTKLFKLGTVSNVSLFAPPLFGFNCNLFNKLILPLIVSTIWVPTSSGLKNFIFFVL
jgi:hypothetical protein